MSLQKLRFLKELHSSRKGLLEALPFIFQVDLRVRPDLFFRLFLILDLLSRNKSLLMITALTSTLTQVRTLALRQSSS